MPGVQIPNPELVVSSHFCIIYFFQSFSLNYNLCCWQSRYVFKTKMIHLPTQSGDFTAIAASQILIQQISFMATLNKHPLKYPLKSFPLSGLFLGGFWGLFFCLFVFWLVGFVIHQPYSFFLVQTPTPQQSTFPRCSGADKLTVSRSRTELSFMVQP